MHPFHSRNVSPNPSRQNTSIRAYVYTKYSVLVNLSIKHLGVFLRHTSLSPCAPALSSTYVVPKSKSEISTPNHLVFPLSHTDGKSRLGLSQTLTPDKGCNHLIPLEIDRYSIAPCSSTIDLKCKQVSCN